MLKLQVSLQGLGRKELVRILQTTSDLEQVDKISLKMYLGSENMNNLKITYH